MAATGDTASACLGQPPVPASLDRLLTARGVDPGHRWIARADLDGDGHSDALVYLDDRAWCGSGGCTLLVLRNLARGWREVSRITVALPPVRLLDRRRHGWHALAVHVAGGGVADGDVVLDFDGRRYPRNPTLLPAAPGRTLTGKILLDAGPDGSPRCPR